MAKTKTAENAATKKPENRKQMGVLAGKSADYREGYRVGTAFDFFRVQNHGWLSRNGLKRLLTTWPQLAKHLNKPVFGESAEFVKQLDTATRRGRGMKDQSLLGALAQVLDPKVKNEWDAVFFWRRTITDIDIDYLAKGANVPEWVEGFCVGALRWLIICVLRNVAATVPALLSESESEFTLKLADFIASPLDQLPDWGKCSYGNCKL